MSEDKKPVEEKPVEEPKVETTINDVKAEEQTAEAPVEAKEEKPAEEPKVEAPETEVKAEEQPAEAPVEVKEEKPAEEPRIEGAVNKGDFILVEMTGRAEETGEVFDTTSEDVAKEKGIHHEDHVYGPRLVVVGEGWVLRGLDARLKGIKPNEQTAIEVPASGGLRRTRPKQRPNPPIPHPQKQGRKPSSRSRT